MAALIGMDYDTTGAAIYGTRFRTFSIDGEKGKTFSDVIAFASIRQSHAIEQVTSAMSSVVEIRQQKVHDLAEVIAVLNEAVASIGGKSSDKPEDRWSSMDGNKLVNANTLLSKYGLSTIPLGGGNQVNYSNAMKKQNDVQYALDTEDNDLQQNMTALQSLISKRDNAFSTANKVIQKNNSTAKATIAAMGS